MEWILILSLFSNDIGNYIQTFNSEKECKLEMQKIIRNNDDNKNIKYIGCMNAMLADNREE